jgi:hypothetical protein
MRIKGNWLLPTIPDHAHIPSWSTGSKSPLCTLGDEEVSSMLQF